MSHAWRDMPLGEIATVSWGDTSTTKAAFTESGFTAYSASGPDGQLPYADHDQPGVVLSAIGAKCGKTWLATGRWSCIKNTIWFRSASPEIDTAFLYYATAKPEFWPRRGAAQPFVSLGDAKQLLISVPTIEVQKKVVAILSAYDELIENNTRRIKILEEMAQSIYKEWFVNFRYPGHENIPLVDSELGPIPEGWDTTPLSEASELVSRGVSPKYDEDSDALVVNQKCVRDGRLSMALARRHSSRVPEAKMLRFGDVLVNSTGVGTLGRVAQVYEDLADVTADSHVTIVRPNQSLAHTDFLGLALLGLADEFASMGAGSTGQTELSRARIGAVVLSVPPRPLQIKFSETVEPLRRLPVALGAANRSLRATRDLLLPRLVSGEIDVSDLDVSCG